MLPSGRCSARSAIHNHASWSDKDDGPFFGIKPVPQPSNGPLPGRGIWHDDGSTVGTCQVAVPGTASPASGSGVEAQSASSDVSFATDSEVEP